MTEEEVQAFNRLSARVKVLPLAVVGLCRETLRGPDIDAILTPIDEGVARRNPELAEIVNEELAALRLEIMKPAMAIESADA